jgi:hypothetical protein
VLLITVHNPIWQSADHIRVALLSSKPPIFETIMTITLLLNTLFRPALEMRLVSPYKFVFYMYPVRISPELPATMTKIFVVFLGYSTWCNDKPLKKTKTVHFKTRTHSTALIILPPHMPVYIYAVEINSKEKRCSWDVNICSANQEISSFHGIWKSITMFTIAHHWTRPRTTESKPCSNRIFLWDWITEFFRSGQ